jgi:hypothetical protein
VQTRKGIKEDQDKERDPEEDYKHIDYRFHSAQGQLIQGLAEWKELGGDKARIEEFFKEEFNKLKELKEYISNYAYSIPAFNYQNYLSTLESLG